MNYKTMIKTGAIRTLKPQREGSEAFYMVVVENDTVEVPLLLYKLIVELERELNNKQEAL